MKSHRKVCPRPQFCLHRRRHHLDLSPHMDSLQMGSAHSCRLQFRWHRFGCMLLVCLQLRLCYANLSCWSGMRTYMRGLLAASR